MTTIEEALRAYLLTQPAVTALLGASPLRLYPDTLPEKVTLPAGTFQRVSTARQYTQDGDDPYRTVRVQLTFTAPTRSQARQVAGAVLAVVSGKSWRSSGVFVASERDDFDPSTGRYRVVADLLISTTEEN